MGERQSVVKNDCEASCLGSLLMDKMMDKTRVLECGPWTSGNRVPGQLLEMPMLWSTPGLPNQILWGGDTAICLNKSSR